MRYTGSFLFIILLLCNSIKAQVSLPSGMPSGEDLILWLSPDTALYRPTGTVAAVNQRVDKWHDISGNGFIFDAPTNGVRPRLREEGGFRYLEFTGGDFLENILIRDSINGLTEFSIFMVIKSDNTNTDNGFLDSEDPNGTDDKICLRYDANGANTGRTNILKSGLGGNLANQQVETQNNTQTTNRQVLSITWSINDRLRVYIDGTLNDTSINPISTALSGINKIMIGKGPKDVNANQGWEGKIGSVIFYKKEYSPDTINAISQTIQTVESVQSGNWNDQNTWDCGCIPPTTSNVTINSGHTVTITANSTMDNLFISNGAILDGGNANFRIVLDGDWNNLGSFNAGNSVVVFRGASDQKTVGNTLFYDLNLNSTSNLNLTLGSTQIQGTLNLVNGNLNTNGNLVIRSNSTGTGRLAAIGFGTINGTATVQRYIDAGGTNWRYLSSPVSNGIIASWNDDFITSGFTGSDFPTFPFTSIYTYNEGTFGNKSSGYEPATNTSNTLGVGQGFSVWCGDTITGTQAFTIDVTGNLNTGTIALPVTYTPDPGQPSTENGWNLVGNPYASSIDWEDTDWDKFNVADAIYIWNPDIGQYSSYIAGAGTNGGSRFIPSSQAFWVQTTGLIPRLTANENVKNATDQPFLRLKSPDPLISIRLNGNGLSDETVIAVRDSASDRFDNQYDALKLYSSQASVPSISTELAGVEYAVNSIAVPVKDQSIPVKVNVKHAGDYTFKIGYPTVRPLSCVIFEDRLKKKFIVISNDTTYTTYVSDTSSSPRFFIHLGGSGVIEKRELTCQSDNNGIIIIEGNGNGPWNYFWRDEKNQLIRSVLNSSSADSLENLPSGSYKYTIENHGVCANISNEVQLTAQSSLTADFDFSFKTVDSTTTVQFENNSQNYSSVFWTFGDGKESKEKNPEHTYKTSGEYEVRLVNTDEFNCQESAVKTLEIVLRTTGKGSYNPEKLIAFPNPASSFINLNRNDSGELIDIQGRIILTYRNQNQINIGDVPAGFYILRSSSGRQLSIEIL